MLVSLQFAGMLPFSRRCIVLKSVRAATSARLKAAGYPGRNYLSRRWAFVFCRIRARMLLSI